MRSVEGSDGPLKTVKVPGIQDLHQDEENLQQDEDQQGVSHVLADTVQ